MIIFKRIRYQNFLAVGNAGMTIDLDRSPTTLITGTNGAGKSTILSAICFALYGKPFRNINKGQVVNSVNNKDCVTEIDFSIGTKQYKVIRGLKPGIFEIWIDGELLHQQASVRDYQTILEKQILKMNFQVFTQVVIIGKGYIPFMALQPYQRREVIEDLLDIKVFTHMHTLAKSHVSELKEAVKDGKQKLSLIRNKIEIKKEHRASMQEASNTRVAAIELSRKGKSDELTALSQTLEDLKIEEAELNASVAEKKTLLERKTKVDTLQQRLYNTSTKIKSGIQFFITNSECPTCNQAITEEYKQQIVEQKQVQLDEVVEGMKQLEEKGSAIDGSLTVYEEKHNALHQLILQKTTLITRITEIEEAIISYDEMIASNSQNDADQIAEINHQIHQLQQEANVIISDQQQRKEDLEYWEFVVICLKDSGIKAEVIKKYIPLINQRVNFYLQKLDFFVLFELDENFNEKIKSRHRDEFTYYSFSEGEKQRIDLALLFAWRDVSKAKNAAQTNILMIDEVLDGSLDKTGTDNLLSILTAIDKINVFVISHNTGAYESFRSHIRIEKSGNFSVFGEEPA